MAWKFNNEKAIYLQIMDKIKTDILGGTVPIGAKFNTVREMAIIAGVNPNTMQKALSDLEQEGFLITNRTNGRFVTEDTNLLSTYKAQIADSLVEQFTNSMKEIGYTNEEIITLAHKLLAQSS